jgi:hypothetical protein
MMGKKECLNCFEHEMRICLSDIGLVPVKFAEDIKLKWLIKKSSEICLPIVTQVNCSVIICELNTHAP